MTILFGAVQGVQAMKSEALAKMKSKDAKYVLRAGNQWLHWSGLTLTSDRKNAWSGTIEQGRACRRTFDAAAGCKLIAVQAITPTPVSVEEMQ